MKYLHSGYILFCEKADHADDGRVNALGLFDLVTGGNLPLRLRCDCIIGFGTPYERRQYKGVFTIEGPDGQPLVSHEFNANEPGELLKGHYIYKLDVNILQEGNYTARAVLSNWKDETVWEVSRQFWAMVALAVAPDP
jgi:hypothetical protein